MKRIEQRIANLEEVIEAQSRNEPLIFHLNFVEHGGRVVSSLVIGPHGKQEWKAPEKS